MIQREPSLEQAEARATAARSALQTAIQDAWQWLTPERLKAEGAIAANRQFDNAKAAAGRTVRRHPIAAWSALALLATIVTYLLRRPVAALTRTGLITARSIRQNLARRKKKS